MARATEWNLPLAERDGGVRVQSADTSARSLSNLVISQGRMVSSRKG